MIVTNTQMRSLGWAALLAVCVGMFVVLSLRVHAVNSEVHLAERKIVALKRETLLLETEFQTRASQRQLANWNSVEFGFEAPRADQYLDNERQLASLGQPRGPDAPNPIRVARADTGNAAARAAQDREMVSPLTGEAITLASAAAQSDGGALFADAFGDFLIEASPIRAAKAQTVSGDLTGTALSQDARGGGE
ncbi:hypothetical protein FGU71_01750 [Erythrobacter insulae]|uniref:Uncharacterized protein n=1 Tax=Erythrobacter insulae TaxID=2584124 RepID=A0A547P9A3_9SPHN|nr:hypothetical protein [Erythrobacter insulae]TRD10713.1 hypothetical protein FGU71_01750 [Erythrobacter insulae]